MHIGVLTVSFALPGCRSLKEKRQRLGGLRERFGRYTNLAVCESDLADQHDRAEWSFVAAARSVALVDQTLADVEQRILETTDAEVVRFSREMI